jgi:predicted AlkP superfamily phosphohydrolase/phosphomutase
MANKVLVIGLDGATLDLVKPWAESGFLPNIHQLMKKGHYGKLRSVLPVLSSAAWASFMTGVNPGKHGLIDFVKRRENLYKFDVVNRTHIKRQSLWKVLSDQGKKSIVINVPMTYPPEEINGIIITGLGTPNNKTFTYPKELSEKLIQKGYKVNKDTFFVPGQEAKLIDEINSSTKSLTEVTEDLIKLDWDLFVLVYRDTDEIGHFFWKYMDQSDPGYERSRDNKFQNKILEYYQLIDLQIGKILENIEENTTVIIMSDHGQGPLYKDVYLNEWLLRQGYLKLNLSKNDNPLSLAKKLHITRENVSKTLRRIHLGKLETRIKDVLGEKIDLLPKNERNSLIDSIDWSKTKAYSFGYLGQIYINLENREPNGIVRKEDYRGLLIEIKDKLEDLLDPEDNMPVVDKVVFKEEYFFGENSETSPDLVIIMRDFSYITRQGYELNNKGNLFESPANHESGSHRLDGLLIIAGNQTKSNSIIDGASIMDLFPTILYLLDCKIPQDLDGKILNQAIITNKTEVFDDSIPTQSSIAAEQLTEDENEELTQRLKNLGYLK